MDQLNIDRRPQIRAVFMKSIWTLVCFTAFAACAANLMALDSLYVVKVGDGTAALGTGSTAAFIQQFDLSGSSLGTINLPTADSGANKALTMSGSASSEGFLALSQNGQYLTLGGYAAAPGVAGIAGTASTAVPRVVGRVDIATGTVDTSTV